ncbi:hypothetical protein [Saccharopolyspora kobensis]|nr:hypothetical protein [Saccharopolyspora kobensis]
MAAAGDTHRSSAITTHETALTEPGGPCAAHRIGGAATIGMAEVVKGV